MVEPSNRQGTQQPRKKARRNAGAATDPTQHAPYSYGAAGMLPYQVPADSGSGSAGSYQQPSSPSGIGMGDSSMFAIKTENDVGLQGDGGAGAGGPAGGGHAHLHHAGKGGKGLGKGKGRLVAGDVNIMPTNLPQPALGGFMKPDVLKLPLEVGTRVACKRRDDQYHMARVIERRPAANTTDPSVYDYYVHYLGYNRRMDEWVVQAQLDLDTVEVEIQDPDPKKRKKVLADDHDSDSDHGDFDPNALREHEEFTKVKNIERIELGRYEMETWYFSPFPPEFKDCKKLYFCEYSLQFFKRRSQMMRHMAKVKMRHPPGDEIYRNGNVCMFEVDGKREKAWCRALCHLAKLFLDHKTLYYDVDLFLFYVLCEIDERGAHIVGYFSKEKCSEEGYNLACILMLPCYQRKGYGKALISMSYELSKLEGKVGTPERPLSDLGRVSYYGYWTRVLLKLLSEHQGTISIKELSEKTAIRTDDVVLTLTQLGLIQYQKGQHVLCAAPNVIQQKLKQAGGPGLVIDPSKIVWTPYNAEREYDKYRP